MGLPEHADLGVTIPPGIDLMALPGMKQALRFGLWKGLGQMMIYPAKLHIPIMANSGIEPQSTGMIRVTVLEGSNFSKRAEVGRKHGEKGKKSKGLMGSIFKGDRYLVQMNTRATRVITLKDKSTDAPKWNETHYFLTNPDSVLKTALYTTSMKEMGRCELPLGQLMSEENAGKVFRMHLPIGEVGIFEKEPPEPREPSSPNATPEELEDIEDEHEVLLQKHAVEVATARANCLVKARNGRPDPDMPSIECEIECVSFASSSSSASASDGNNNTTNKTGAGAGVGSMGNKGEGKGILTVFLNRAVHINDLASRAKPKPAATCTCAGQRYTTKQIMEKTNKPLWDESFIFFNVSPDEKMNISVTDGDANGEFLGEVNVDVADVAKNIEVHDSFHLSGVKTSAQVTARLKFTYMSL